MERVKSVKIVVISTLLCFLITFLLFWVYAFLLAYTNVSEDRIPIVTCWINLFSILIASLWGGFWMKQKGLKTGIKIGTLYLMVMFIIKGIHTGFSFTKMPYWMFLGYLLMGMLGGILGVNLKANKRKK